jgi:hypothetical protein
VAERWSSWFTGFVFGLGLAIGFGVFGTFLLLAGIGILIAGAVSSRSVALASGAFVGGGVAYAGLLWMGASRCSGMDQQLGRCEGPDLSPYVIQAAIAVTIGLVLGGWALLRRRGAMTD